MRVTDMLGAILLTGFAVGLPFHLRWSIRQVRKPAQLAASEEATTGQLAA